MEIRTFATLPSTQEYLIYEIKRGRINDEICIIATHQSKGIGSRGNAWNSVNRGLYFSFVKRLSDLPKDLKLESISIFFGFIWKEILASNGSKAWLKYPNDLYLGEHKIGGVMCNIIGGFAVCGIGLNIESSDFACIERGIIGDINSLLYSYFERIDKCTWEHVFNRYKLEFDKNAKFYFHHRDRTISFKNAKLLNDGAIEVNGEILYSLR